MEEEKKLTPEEIREKIRIEAEERRAKMKEAGEVQMAGKGILTLEVPIKSGDTEITELPYDFTALTGLDYTDAMDSDPNAVNAFKLTYRQALALFAKAAAKQTPRLDMKDIVERIGMTDAETGMQLATLFFAASSRAGQMRLSKKS